MSRAIRPAAKRYRRPRAAAAAALAICTGLLISTPGWSTDASTGAATQAPYEYVMGDVVSADDLGALDALADRDIALRHATVVSAEGKQLAQFDVAETQHGRVAFDWRASVDAPFLRMLPGAGEIAALAPVLERHVPDNGRIFAWWDTSRELRLLAGVDAAFGEHLNMPLFLPPQWQAKRAAIDAAEAAFWQPAAGQAQRQRFQRFAHALLADEKQGVKELQALAGNRSAAFILHPRDIILLGQMAPAKIGVAFRDFPNTGDVHGMVRSVRAWMKQQGYYAYAIMGQRDNQVVRVVALTDEASGRTLAARLLPFVGNDRQTVPGTVLVYRTGGFWVYQLGPTPGEDAAKG